MWVTVKRTWCNLIFHLLNIYNPSFHPCCWGTHSSVYNILYVQTSQMIFFSMFQTFIILTTLLLGYKSLKLCWHWLYALSHLHKSSLIYHGRILSGRFHSHILFQYWGKPSPTKEHSLPWLLLFPLVHHFINFIILFNSVFASKWKPCSPKHNQVILYSTYQYY